MVTHVFSGSKADVTGGSGILLILGAKRKTLETWGWISVVEHLLVKGPGFHLWWKKKKRVAYGVSIFHVT